MVVSLAENLFREIEEKSDGFFSVESHNGRAVLTVSQAGLKGKPVTSQDVIVRLKALRIGSAELSKIKQIVEEADGRPHEIGIWQTPEKEDAYAEIEITADAMAASIYLYPPLYDGNPLREDQLRAIIAEANIHYGIFEEELTCLAEQPRYSSAIQIAQGVPAIDGKEGYLRKKNAGRSMGPKLKDDGSVDHRELGVFVSVAKDGVIAEIVPAVAGRDGMDVHGRVIPAKVSEPPQFEIGPNVYVSPDGTKLLSSIDGLPVFESGGRVRVDEVLYLENVDYSTGNIDFPGTIVVEGKLADGFSLTTQGSIIIQESVGKVFLKAAGDITLASGFMGRGEGRIEAEGDIRARFVEQGKLVAGRSIYIAEAAMHSFLIAQENIILKGRRGEIIGGEAVAGGSIVCCKAGAVVETKTRLTVGTPPEILTALEAMQNEIQQRQMTLVKIENTLRGLADKETRDSLTPQEQETRLRLHSLKDTYHNQLEMTQKQLDTAINTFEARQGAYAFIEKETYPGVEICFGKSRTWRAGIRSIVGKLSVYLNEADTVSVGNSPPHQSLKKTPAGS